MFTIYHIRSLRRILTAPIALLCIAMMMLPSCQTTKGVLSVNSVTYQAIDTKVSQKDMGGLPESTKIFTTYAVDKNGKIAVVIKNLTDSIMTIDQEKSFFINTTGQTQPYYDPNVYANTTTDFSFATVGVWTNLGTLADSFGVYGPLNSVLYDMGISRSNTVGSSIANTIMIIDQKQINIAPHATVALSKAYPIFGVGQNNVHNSAMPAEMTYTTSPLKFSIYISYSCDGGKYYEKISTDFYVSSSIYEPVGTSNKVNDALRRIMKSKPDMFNQPWYMISFNNNLYTESDNNFYIYDATADSDVYDNIVHGMLYNFK